MEAIINKPIGLFTPFDAALTLCSSWSPEKVKPGGLEPSRKIRPGIMHVKASQENVSFPSVLPFVCRTGLPLNPMCFQREKYVLHLLFVVVFCQLPTQENARSLALHSNGPTCGHLWYFSQNTVPLSQTHCTFLSTPYSVAFTLLCSDWIHFVRTGLVHLYLFREPTLHETFPDTPSYNWFLSPLGFLVPYQIAWHDIYLW